MSEQNEKETPLHFGEYLKEARLRKGLTVGQVCHETRLSRLMVESIENGDRKSLPEDVYLRSFVRSLADICGADRKEALALLAQQAPLAKGKSPFYSPSAKGKGALIAFLVFGVAAACLLFFWIGPVKQGLP